MTGLCGSVEGSFERKKGNEAVREGLRMKQRDYTRKYSLIANACDVTVCKHMFLHTLGYKHDTILTKMFSAMTRISILLRAILSHSNQQ